jgi:ribonucleoside-diphosphate reductase alpha chain
MQVEDWLGKDNKLGIDIWNKKYKYENETFDEWLNRISNNNEQLKNAIVQKKFLFGGRILSNRGLYNKGLKVTYSNCYVVTPPEDNIESIFDCAKKLARTYSYGGGCGIDISKLAPRGAKVNNTAKETSGSVSFMDLYSLTTSLIGQNGRRGALMISIDCNHPDLEEFIGVKSDLNKVTKANISIKVTNDFLDAVKNNTDYKLKFTRLETGDSITKTVKAKDIFDKIAKMNWDFAEPGFLFWDRIKSWNLLSNTKEFEYAGTNPCAEEPLPAGGSCLLGSINLSEFVNNPFTNKAEFNYEDFKITVNLAVNALNEVLDEGLPLHPLQEQKDSVRNWRQIGLGIMGLADMLIKMGITYGSNESIELCDKVAHTMIDSAINSSALLAKDNGMFSKCNIDEITTTPFYIHAATENTDKNVKQYGLRNSQLLTIAPTGTLSTMLGISGGIEPIFANYYERKTQSLYGKDVVYKVYTPIVDKYMKQNNIKDDKDLPSYFITAQNLNYKNRINMQSIWQSYIDASISSTVNLPNNTTVEDVEQLYLYAGDKGLKGITIYRDGCKRSGILTTNESNDSDSKKTLTEDDLPWGTVLDSCDDLIGRKKKIVSGCGSVHVTCWFDPSNGRMREIYIDKGSKGGCLSWLTASSRLISIALRTGTPIESIADQLMSAPACTSYTNRTVTKHDTSNGNSCASAIAMAMLEMQKSVNEELGLIEDDDSNQNINNNKEIINPCPQCGSELSFEGGCNTCHNCGWSKCN